MPASKKHEANRQAVCQHCGTAFVKRQASQPGKYCSLACKAKGTTFLPKIEVSCKWCKATFIPHGRNPGIYCSRSCKSEWQRTQKPADAEWLYEKYWIEGLDCVAISKIVKRHSKRVWEWLQDLEIPTRPRGSYWEQQPAFCFWKTPGGKHPMEGKKFGPEFCKKQSEIAKAQGRVPYDPAVGSYMKGRKGAEVPSWKGGITPERNAFYSSPEWKLAVRTVWGRDKATCQRCGKKYHRDLRGQFDIHHIVSFAYAPLRAEVSNLVLLCEVCHYWVHSNENTERQFIKDIPCAA